MKNIVVDKSIDDAEPHSICFLTQYSASKKVFISERDQDREAKKSKRCLQSNWLRATLKRKFSSTFQEIVVK